MTDDIKHQCPPGWVAVPVADLEALRDQHAGGCGCYQCEYVRPIIARLPKPPAYTEEDVALAAGVIAACWSGGNSPRDFAREVIEALAEAGRLKPVEEER